MFDNFYHDICICGRVSGIYIYVSIYIYIHIYISGKCLRHLQSEQNHSWFMTQIYYCIKNCKLKPREKLNREHVFLFVLKTKLGKFEGFDSCYRPSNLTQIRFQSTTKFDRWPSKTIGHLFYATSSFVHHFVAIGEFKLELQSGNARFGWHSNILSGVTLKFDRWHEKNNRAPLLCYFKLCASFRSHWWIQIRVTAQFRSKSTIFFSRVTLKFDRWPAKTIGHLFYATSSFLHHFVAIGEFKLELQPNFGQNRRFF